MLYSLYVIANPGFWGEACPPYLVLRKAGNLDLYNIHQMYRLLRHFVPCNDNDLKLLIDNQSFLATTIATLVGHCDGKSWAFILFKSLSRDNIIPSQNNNSLSQTTSSKSK